MKEPTVQTRPDPRPPRALALTALVLLAALSLGIIATSQTLWVDPVFERAAGG